ncbi:TPA: DUF4265 domain-containing protein [Stenotrophomonas maltophilia]|nr:DUF4265 domain-containing protein [Stenotrophomonas maltophilia]
MTGFHGTRMTKVFFQLEPDADGYPPVSVESVWATPGKAEREYVIDNIPFFEAEAALGDTIHVQEREGQLWFDRVVSRSENSLIRIVFFDKSCVETVKSQLESLGCSTEYLRQYDLLAVNVPSSANLADVQAYLRSEERAGRIDSEEPILRRDG